MITNENGSSLSERQVKTAIDLVKSGLSIDEFVESYGSGNDMADWIDSDEFIDYASALADRYAHANKPFVWSRLFKMIKEDNVQAIRLFFSVNEKNKPSPPSPSAFKPDNEIEELRREIFGKE